MNRLFLFCSLTLYCNHSLFCYKLWNNSMERQFGKERNNEESVFFPTYLEARFGHFYVEWNDSVTRAVQSCQEICFLNACSSKTLGTRVTSRQYTCSRKEKVRRQWLHSEQYRTWISSSSEIPNRTEQVICQTNRGKDQKNKEKIKNRTFLFHHASQNKGKLYQRKPAVSKKQNICSTS